MPSLSDLTNPRAYHIIAYGTLLGSTFFQSFIAGPVAFKAIPRSSFAQLQTHVTPVFFALQSVLPIVMAVTFPGERVGSAGAMLLREASGVTGLLQPKHFWTSISFGVMLGTALINLAMLGPMTTTTMRERKHQETRDGKKSNEPPYSDAMKKLNAKFGALHGASASTNLLGLIAMIVYGMDLSLKL